MLSEKARQRARERCEKFGLRVECLRCGARGRHFTGRGKRLRELVHAAGVCGGPVRPVWWLEKFPERAAYERSRAGHPSYRFD